MKCHSFPIPLKARALETPIDKPALVSMLSRRGGGAEPPPMSGKLPAVAQQFKLALLKNPTMKSPQPYPALPPVDFLMASPHLRRSRNIPPIPAEHASKTHKPCRTIIYNQYMVARKYACIKPR
jgi:hypothetical protein